MSTRTEVPREGESLWGKGSRKALPDYKIDHETGCWNWLKGLTKQGYPHSYAHRLYWEAVNGPRPEGWHMHHKCRNPRCVNPDHLEPVDPDTHYIHHFLHEKGLTLEDVREIRRLGRDARTKYYELTERYGVTDMTIYWIWTGRSWARFCGEEGPVRVDLGREKCAFEDCDTIVPPERRRHAKYCSARCRSRASSRVRNRRLAAEKASGGALLTQRGSEEA